MPPLELANRVGALPSDRWQAAFDELGAAIRGEVDRLLPADWVWDGKRALDFGSGAGRALRHFADLVPHNAFWGCDVHGASIDWLNGHLAPMRGLACGHAPGLPLEDGSLDLVWATSVFTHIDRWSLWLLEMHRVLAPDGLLIASWLGEGMWEALVGEPYIEDQVGMTTLRHWHHGDGGPDVLHSEWWLRAHWGRAFEILDVARPPRQPDGSAQVTHSYVVMRKRAGEWTTDALEWCDPDEPRELAALQTNVRLLRAEIDALARRPLGSIARSTLRDVALHPRLRGPLRRARRAVSGWR
jgi:SAM-dependent methyltransferase